jgi:large subunit ribosomal protein L21
MYAVVEIQGKQYKAEKGAVLHVDKLSDEEGSDVEFESVLLVSSDDEVRVGKPYVDGVSVKGIVKTHDRDKKIVVRKYKRRKGYARKQGHRQDYTEIQVDDITGV